ncbi:uncharacterized protein LOC120295542 [Eucalyptus grandis]|uniref:uncharacterized protein LOC120295542 n=1 Tax=Eucalyptus grandis TaxID=71139 RepID=UPI00192F07FF|nr:uncharacterized protein LOC120295542 [Eucalyptus grandis]
MGQQTENAPAATMDGSVPDESTWLTMWGRCSSPLAACAGKGIATVAAAYLIVMVLIWAVGELKRFCEPRRHSRVNAAPFPPSGRREPPPLPCPREGVIGRPHHGL